VTTPADPQVWVTESRRVALDDDPAFVGTVTGYRPAVVVVALDNGTTVEADPARLTVGDPAPTDEQATREQVLAALGNNAKVRAGLDALEAAGIRMVRVPKGVK
jgi:hypothetical protein